MIYFENICYVYCLCGFDKEWNYVDRQCIVIYINFLKGEYVFQVKLINSDGVWVENECSLRIIIQFLFWEMVWVMVIYIFVFLLILFLGVYILFIIYCLKYEVFVEQQVFDIKFCFFINIFYEFCILLILIVGFVEYVLKNKILLDDVCE